MGKKYEERVEGMKMTEDGERSGAAGRQLTHHYRRHVTLNPSIVSYLT